MIALRKKALNYMTDQDFPVRFRGDAACNVDVGQEVTPSTVIFEGKESSIEQAINVSKELGVDPSDTKNFLEVSDGEIVDDGDVIAKRSVSIGMAERFVRVSEDGRISLDRVESGFVDVMSAFTETTKKSGVKGVVKSVIPGDRRGREVILSVDGFVFEPFGSRGDDAVGELKFMKEGNSVYTAGDVDEDYEAKVVVAGRLFSRKLYEELVEVGAAGVIFGGAGIKEFNEIKEWPIPIAVTEGWGTVPINAVVIDFFRKAGDITVYLDSLSDSVLFYVNSQSDDLIEEFGGEILKDESDFVEKIAQRSRCFQEIELGRYVKVLDLPFWGYSGRVVDILEEDDLVKIQLESKRIIVVSSQNIVVVD